MNGMVDWAQARGVVRLADGRTGHLIYWPLELEARNSRGRGSQAVIQLPSGAYINADPDTLTRYEGAA